jgi:hypothetical protein
MISWDHPNLLTLSFSSYKRRGVLMGKVSFLVVLELGELCEELLRIANEILV